MGIKDESVCVCVVLGNLLMKVASDVRLIPDSRDLLAQVEGQKAQLSSFVDAGSKLKLLKECLGFCFFFILKKKKDSVGKVYMSKAELSLCVFLDKPVAFHIRQ